MTRPTWCTLAVTLVLLVLVGCGGGPTPTPGTAAGRPATPPPAPAPALSSEPAAASRPSAAAAAAFVVQARKIAPRIVGDDERIATRGANTCTSLTDGRPVEQAVDQAVQRFSSGSYTVTRAEAAQLVEAARSTVCKT